MRNLIISMDEHSPSRMKVPEIASCTGGCLDNCPVRNEDFGANLADRFAECIVYRTGTLQFFPEYRIIHPARNIKEKGFHLQTIGHIECDILLP